MFRKPIEDALYVEAKGAGGRPPFDRLMMFKILILQNGSLKNISKRSILQKIYLISDSIELENLIDEIDNRLYVDSAYRSEKVEKYLKEKK